jgi:hypothetical protein
LTAEFRKRPARDVAALRASTVRGARRLLEIAIKAGPCAEGEPCAAACNLQGQAFTPRKETTMKMIGAALAAVLSVMALGCKHVDGGAAEVKDSQELGDVRDPRSAVGLYRVDRYWGNSHLENVRNIAVTYTQGRDRPFTFKLLDGASHVVKSFDAGYSAYPSSGPNYLYFVANQKVIHYDVVGARVDIDLMYSGSEDAFDLTRVGDTYDDDGAEDSASVPYGCYDVEGYEGTYERGIEKVCIDSTPNSRSGPVTFALKRGNAVVETWGGSLNVAQPRCPGCVGIRGLDGDILIVGPPADRMQIERRRGNEMDLFTLGYGY